MNKLTILNENGQLVTDSREVSEMVGKQHKDLLEKYNSKYVKKRKLLGQFCCRKFFQITKAKNWFITRIFILKNKLKKRYLNI